MGKYAGKTPIGAIAIFSVAALAIVGLHRSPSRAYSAATPPTLFVSDRCSKAVTAYPATGNGDIAPLAPAPSSLSEPQFVALDKNGNIYVTNSCTAAITIYAKGSNGDTPPIATIGGSNTGLRYPAGIALDSSGKIYVADDGLGGLGPGSVFVYPAVGSSTGLLNETPTATISGSNTDLTYPEGIALDSSSKIYVPDRTADSVFVYPALGSSTGLLDEAPTATIAGSNTGLSGPFGIALDSSGKIYVADFFTASVYIFPALGSSTGLLDEARTATIGGSNTGLQRPAGIALDSKGDIYVVDDGPSGVGPASVFAYPAPGSSTGLLDEAPSAAVTAAVTTGLKFPEGIALDSSGNIYVTDNSTASVFVYPAGSNANAAPIATISGSNTGLSYPAGIALDSSGDIYVADYGAASVFVYPALGSSTGLLNETPTATISGSNTGLTAPFGIALDSRGNIYVTDEFAAIVFVYPALGSSTGMLNESSTAYISGSYTGLYTPMGITLDSSGKIYVADEDAARVFVYPALGSSTGQLDEPPTATITSLTFPFGIALDSSGNIYVADYGAASVFVYPAGSNGDAAPSATISGPQTELGEPQFIAIETETGPTPTATATATSTRTGTATATATGTATSTATTTQTATATATSTPTATATSTGSSTPTATATPTASATATATATATPTPVPVKLKIKPTSLKFGTVTVGDHKGPKDVTITNPNKKKRGIMVLIEGYSGAGGAGSPYSVTNGCGASLAAGEECKIGVTFTPTESGEQNATVMIIDNAEHEPQSVKLTGKGKIK